MHVEDWPAVRLVGEHARLDSCVAGGACVIVREAVCETDEAVAVSTAVSLGAEADVVAVNCADE